ncbi:enoyl-CoA hydratase/isomerase family protein [Streptomyces vastus]
MSDRTPGAAVLVEDTGRYGCAFGRIGLIADAGLLWSLPARAGLGTAKRLLLFGDVLDAGEAAALGLADALCEPGSARHKAVRPAGRLTEGAPSSSAETKRILSWPAELDAVLAEEVRAQPHLPAGADFAEGSSAFLAGRAPRFTGPTTTERA